MSYFLFSYLHHCIFHSPSQDYLISLLSPKCFSALRVMLRFHLFSEIFLYSDASFGTFLSFLIHWEPSSRSQAMSVSILTVSTSIWAIAHWYSIMSGFFFFLFHFYLHYWLSYVYFFSGYSGVSNLNLKVAIICHQIILSCFVHRGRFLQQCASRGGRN